MTRVALLRTTALGAALMLASCQTSNITSQLPGGYTADKGDACHAERVALDQSGNTFETEIFRNALIGGVAGAVTAAVTGRNVFVGAGIGVAAAAAGTYLVNLQSNSANATALTNDAIKNVREENQRIDRLLANFDRLRDCRRGEARAVRADLAGGKITKAVAETRMATIKSNYNRDLKQLDDIAKNISNRSESYAAAYNQIAADNGGKHLDASVRPTSAVQATDRTNRASNLRGGPGTNFDRVGRLPAGAEVRIIGSQGSWHKIQNPAGGEAWIAKSLVGKRKASAAPSRIQNKPAEKPIKDDRVKPVKLPNEDKGKVNDLRDVSLANVEKRDEVNNQIATAKVDADQDFTLS